MAIALTGSSVACSCCAAISSRLFFAYSLIPSPVHALKSLRACRAEIQRSSCRQISSRRHCDPAGAQWRLDEICRQLDLCISARQARRLFKACTGLGIKEYAKKRRLEIAAQQLQATDEPVKAIAIDAGYRHVRN